MSVALAMVVPFFAAPAKAPKPVPEGINMALTQFFTFSTSPLVRWTWADGAWIFPEDWFTGSPAEAQRDLKRFILRNTGEIELRWGDQNQAAGPDLTDAAEAGLVVTLVHDALDSNLVVKGPAAPGTTASDTTEPYRWTPENSADITAAFEAIHAGAFHHGINGNSGRLYLDWTP